MPSSHPLPEYYHYTSFEALAAIVKSREIWATSVHYLNDEQEYQEGHALILAQLGAATQANPSSMLLRELGARIHNWKEPYIFVFSLSAVPDLLSQWRAYCPDGAGVCIGFPEKLLKPRAAAHGFDLLPCIYARDAQEQAISELLRNALAAEIAAPKPFDQLLIEVLLQLMRLSPRLKNHSFQEENEWRLISGPLTSGDPRFGFRATRTMLIPFFRFSLAAASEKVSFGNIYVGPNRHIELAMRSVGDLFYSSPHVSHTGVTRSFVPYRTW